MDGFKAIGTFLLMIHIDNSCHAEDSPPEDQTDDGICTLVVVRPHQVIPESHLKNCEIWVRFRYKDPEVYDDVNLEILNSKPPEVYDDEALGVLNQCLSAKGRCSLSYRTERTISLGEKCGTTSTYTIKGYHLSSIIDERGRKMKQFDFYRGCQEPKIQDE